MQGSLRKLLIYNLIVLLVAVQLVIVINYWYFVFKNITHAGIRDTISYQGKIVDLNSVAITDANYKMRFSIYDHSASTDDGDKLLWTEEWDGTDQDLTSPESQNSLVSVNGGIFSVELNSLCGSWVGGCASNGGVDFSSSSLYLLVELDKEGEGAYEESFLPRKRFSSTAYSMNTARLDGYVIGESGSTIPLLSGTNSWSGANSFASLTISSLNSGVNTTNMMSGAATSAATPTIPSIANPNIVSYWKFDEGTGATSADAVGGRTLNMDNASWLTGGAFGYTGDNGASLNGSAQNITVTDDVGLNPSDITIYAWVKTSDTGVLRGLVDKGWQNGGYILQLRNGIPSFDTQDGSNNFYISTGTTNVADNAWHMIAGTFDSTTQELKIYVDGALENTTTSALMADTTALDMVIGGDNVSSNRLSGLLDNIVIYNSANAAADILADYNASIGIPTGDKLAYNFDTSTSLAPTDKLASWKSAGTEKSFLYGDGGLFISSVVDSTNNKELVFNSSASAVNYLTMTNGATTASPIISADGETDLSLYIKPKGTGSIIIASQSAAAVPLIVIGADSQTGNLQEWRNNAGVPLLSVSSIGNLTMSNASPEIRMTNSDASTYSRLNRVTADNTLTLYNQLITPEAAITSYQINFAATQQITTTYNVDLDTDSFSVSAWVKPADISSNSYTIFGATNAGYTGGYWILMHRADRGGVTLQSQGGGQVINFTTPTADLVAGQWAHIVMVKSGSNVKIYQNNVKITDETILNLAEFTTAPITIAAINSGNYFNGSMDEPTVWSKVLSEPEITTLYNAGAGLYGSAETGLVIGYHFNENTGTSLTDYSGNGYTGTLSGAVTWGAAEKAIPVTGTASEVAILQSKNGVASGEVGILTIGATAGTTKIIGGNVWLGSDELLSVSSAGILTSGVPDGTAPFVVTSTTKVTNLNADLLDGHDTAYFEGLGGGGGGSPDGNSWALIYDYTVPDTPGFVDSVTADASSTIGSVALDGDADGVYQIVMSVIHVQNGASINIQPNGDNGFHYFFQYTLSDGGTVSSGRGPSYDSLPGTYATLAPSSSMYTGVLYAKRNGYARLSKAEIVRDGSSSSINMQNVVAGWVSDDNITSIKFQSNVLNAIGAGSRFMIWKKN